MHVRDLHKAVGPSEHSFSLLPAEPGHRESGQPLRAGRDGHGLGHEGGSREGGWLQQGNPLASEGQAVLGLEDVDLVLLQEGEGDVHVHGQVLNHHGAELEGGVAGALAGPQREGERGNRPAQHLHGGAGLGRLNLPAGLERF